MGRITAAEWIVAALVGVVMILLVVAEPEILEAPVENANTIRFTVVGTLVAAALLVGMLWWNVRPVIRMVVLWVPFAIVSWWLISPFFIDEVVEDEFVTSIAAELDAGADLPDVASDIPTDESDPTDSTGDEQLPSTSVRPVEGAVPDTAPDVGPPATDATPVLLGAGQFVGLAGHSGTGDAGIFENPDGSLVLRLERFDIQNGPDLELYVVPGADQTSLGEGSIHLGALRGNVGNQTYELPAGTTLASGPHTVLVWCEAFSVEFVGATLTI